MNDDQAALGFGALANPDRLRTLRCLVRAGPNGMPAGEIARAIGASPSRASFHLTALSEAGFVKSDRHSRSVRYRVDFEAIGTTLQHLLEDCCADDPALKACCRG